MRFSGLNLISGNSEYRTKLKIMLDFLLSHLGSIGLFLDMIGVSILFFVVIEIGEQVILADEKEESNRLAKKGKKENILKFGYGLIFFGFVLQLFSNEISNSSLNRLKCKIESNNVTIPAILTP